MLHEQLSDGTQKDHVPEGLPTGIQSNRGEQLVAASKQTESRDIEGITNWASKKGQSGIYCP